MRKTRPSKRRRPVSKKSSGSSPRGLVECTELNPCARCQADQAFLRSKNRSANSADTSPICAVDLFGGCGGLSVGLQEAADRLGRVVTFGLAADSDPEVVKIYNQNVTEASAKAVDVTTLFDGRFGDPPTPSERKLLETLPAVSILLGGPPCQGHSNLNNHTRRSDPKNALYLTMARAAEILSPQIVVIENVTAVQWDHSSVVEATTDSLKKQGFAVAGRVIDLKSLGVPQRRRRFVLLASRVPGLDPSQLLDTIVSSWGKHHPRTVGWAIRDLLAAKREGTFDTPSRKSEKSQRRMAYLFEKGTYNLPNKRRPKCHRIGKHSYISVYGRLRWDEPAQTITTGYGCMGQGRYVHPQRRRTITPHEAARLQTFPDWFDFGAETPRGVLAKAIGNAVPPLLMVELGKHLIAALTKAKKATEQAV